MPCGIGIGIGIEIEREDTTVQRQAQGLPHTPYDVTSIVWLPEKFVFTLK
jgi:hypothetical protein